jgi:DNA-directed RNA polymerase specialized sigma24 family protein
MTAVSISDRLVRSILNAWPNHSQTMTLLMFLDASSRRLYGSYADCEDAAGELVLDLFKQQTRSQVIKARYPRRFLVTMLRNKHSTLMRRRRPDVGVSEQIFEDMAQPSPPPSSFDELTKSLTAQEYQLLDLWFRQGRKGKEIAHVLDISPSNAYALRQKILRKLRAVFAGDIVDAS